MTKDDFEGLSLDLLRDQEATRVFLSNKPIKNKLRLLLAPPTLVVIFLLVVIALNASANIYHQYRINRVVAASQILSMVAHNFAVERGLSAGFLGSKGVSGADKVKGQRIKADLAAQDLMDNLRQIRSYTLNDNSEALLDELVTLINRRGDFRKKVDALDPASGFFGYYSTVNSHSLRLLEQLSVYLDDKGLSSTYKALTQLLWLKERAGQSRGALNHFGFYSPPLAA